MSLAFLLGDFMLDQYFGIKELYEVVLRAKTPMQIGARYVEAQEPILYFENITMSTLSEKDSPIMARGGWANMPRVIWEDRSEVQFVLSEGVMSSISMGILLSANITQNTESEPLLVNKKQGPTVLDANHQLYLEHWPVESDVKKTFIFEYTRDVAQKKLYGKRIRGVEDPFDPSIEIPTLEIYEDKALTTLAPLDKHYVVDYYYEYNEPALIYTIQKERFNGLFTLEGKFYSKDENDGLNYTNLIYMPKVRVVSDINLRLGERANPTVGVFNIIGLPENVGGNKKSMILEITRLGKDIDGDL